MTSSTGHPTVKGRTRFPRTGHDRLAGARRDAGRLRGGRDAGLEGTPGAAGARPGDPPTDPGPGAMAPGRRGRHHAAVGTGPADRRLLDLLHRQQPPDRHPAHLHGGGRMGGPGRIHRPVGFGAGYLHRLRVPGDVSSGAPSGRRHAVDPGHAGGVLVRSHGHCRQPVLGVYIGRRSRVQPLRLGALVARGRTPRRAGRQPPPAEPHPHGGPPTGALRGVRRFLGTLRNRDRLAGRRPPGNLLAGGGPAAGP